MNILEVREKTAENTFLNAHVIHDVNTTGWHIHLVDKSGNEIPITDGFSEPITYSTLADVQEVVDGLNHIPMHIDTLYRHYAV